MKRHVFMVACTFGVLLLALLVYQWVTTGKIGFVDFSHSHGSNEVSVIAAKPGAGIVPRGPGKQLYIEDRKPDGHLDAIYQASQWEKLSDTTYKLIEPRIQMFTRAGTEVDVTAREGFVEAQELAKGENIRHGSLTGDVKIVYDPSTELQRSPWEQRQDEVVRILVDHISFDNDRLMINTDSEVQVYSPQADMFGKGLMLSWNQAPQELAELRIDHGRQIIVKKVPAEFTSALPTGGDTVVTDSNTPGPARADLPPNLAPAVATSPVAPTTQPQGAAPGQTGKPEQKPAQNVMIAELIGSDKLIDVEHGQQSVHGAKSLKFQFEWDQSKGRGGLLGPTSKPAAPGAKTPEGSGGPAKPGPAGPGPVAAATSKQANEPAQEHMVITWQGPLVVKPCGYTPRPSNKNYIVRGEGDGVRLNDVGAKATCARFDMTSPQQDAHLYGSDGKPAHMELSTGEVIDCAAMHYYHQGQKDKRVGVADLSGPGVMVRRVTTRPAVAAAAGADDKAQPSSRPAGQDRNAEDRITWATSVHAILVPDTARDALAQAQIDKATGQPAAGSQTPFGARSREHISEATFEGNVELFQSATGDFLNSDHLHVTMGRGKSGQPYPSVAVATGNVRGRFRSNDNPEHPQITVFSSQEGTLNFKEDPNPQAKSPSQPSIFEAKKDVTFTYGPDPSTPGADKAQTPVTGKADSMTGDVAAHTAVLYGSPASLTQGTNVLTGPQIELDQYSGMGPAARGARKPSGPTARVHGKGTLNFTSDRDMNGNQLAKARPVEVTWSKGMVYDGNVKPEPIAKGDANVVITARATFTGEVVFNSEPKVLSTHEEHGRDHLQSQQMVISFADRGAATRPATVPPAAAATSRPAGGSLDMQFSGRSVVRMTAQTQVVLNSFRMLKDERPDSPDRATEFVLRREEVTGDFMLYDAIANEVSMIGPGDMVAEDYRPPAAGAGDAGTAQAAPGDNNQLQPPYQFYATWKDGMTIDQNSRTVTLKGRVTGGYRGGAQILLKESIKMPPGPKPPPGQIFAGTCDKMVAQFFAPQAQGQAKSANLDEGPRLGPPKIIDAFGKVNMTVDATGRQKAVGETPEPTWQIFGDQIHYERPADAEGKPILDKPATAFVEAVPDAKGQYRNAQVVHQDKPKGVSDDCIAPRIDMTIKDGEIVKVEAKKITGVR